MPVKHFTGRFHAPEAELDAMEERGQVVFRYAPGQNPNGSERDIAGVSNETGNVLGLMPHPEHASDPLTGSSDGTLVFESMARHVEAAWPASSRSVSPGWSPATAGRHTSGGHGASAAA